MNKHYDYLIVGGRAVWLGLFLRDETKGENLSGD